MEILNEVDTYLFPIDSIFSFMLHLEYDYISDVKTAKIAYSLSEDSFEFPYEIPIKRAYNLIDSLSKKE